MNRFIFWLLLSFTFGSTGQSQLPFSISLEPLTIDGLGGLQSYAYGTHEGKWVIFGGRLDGLHRRQPWATFDIPGHNILIWVVDPVTQEVWTEPLTELESALQEQLSATNIQFAQRETDLILVGGYGYSATQQDHTTYPYLTVVDLPALVNAILNEGAISTCFRQVSNPQFAVTGGHLLYLDEVYYLVGGQKFEGRYNPMDHPTFTQEYTEAIRRFSLDLSSGTDLGVTFLPEWNDPQELHRRDYNVCPQIFPDGTRGMTAFSGVFRTDADLPFLHPVDISTDGYSPVPTFNQLYNHYHCATLPLFAEQANEMHTVFFGGIAQFYQNEDGMIIQDDDVPFVRTIAVVSRTADGTLSETKLEVEMPDYVGAAAEFIPAPDIPLLENEIVDLDAWNAPIMAGYIYGGINSSAANIFFDNEGDLSEASPVIYKVYLEKTISSTNDPVPVSALLENIALYPNPTEGMIYVEFNLARAGQIRLYFTDSTGRQTEEVSLARSWFPAGDHLLELQVPPGSSFLTLTTGEEQVTRAVSQE